MKKSIETNSEPIRQWMLLYYKMFNLGEIEYHCELPAKAIFNDLAGNFQMSKEEWFCVYKELNAIFTAMPS